MRLVARRRLVLALAVGPLLVACGVILDVPDEPAATPVRVDAGLGDGSISGQQDGGTIVLDPDASDSAAACATPAVCSPEKLATVGGQVYRLVVSGSSVYAGHQKGGDSHVSRLARGAPGPAVDLDPFATTPSNFRSDSNIVVDSSGAVYWGTANGLRRHEPDGGADASTDAGVTELSALGAPVSAARLGADGRLYFGVSSVVGAGAPNAGRFASCALPGCTDVQPVGSAPYVQDVLLIQGARFWIGFDDALTGFVFRKPGVVISSLQLTPSRLATDGLAIYWSTADNLRMYTIGTSTLSDLLPAATDASTRVNGVAVDPAGAIYVTKESTVLRCTITAGKCAFTPIATTASPALDVAADATHVYWGLKDGSIWRLSK